MKIRHFTTLLLITFFSFNIAAQDQEYILQINLDYENLQMNSVEKLHLPVLLLKENYLITRISESRLNELKNITSDFRIIKAIPAGTSIYLISSNPKNLMKASDPGIDVIFTDNNEFIAAGEIFKPADLAAKGYTSVLLEGKNYFRNIRSVKPAGFPLKADSIINSVVSLINKDSVAYFIQSLQNFQTRFLFAPNRDSVSVWIKDEFMRMGYTDVKLDSFQYDGTWQKNVVATLPGAALPDKYIVTGGHHDSYSLGNPLIFAPGADDNASGTAAVLETARVLKQYGYQPEMTIKFITFAAEEYGLWGSKDYALKAVTANMDIKLMINHDMISHTLQPASSRQVDINYYSGSEAYRELAKIMTSQYTMLSPKNGSANSPSSDSHSFWTQGYNAVYFEETNFSPYYHSPQDIISNYNMEFCAEVIKGSCATLMSAITIPDQVNNFTLADPGTGSTLIASWSPNTEPDLNGYKIYVGTSSGSYNYSLFTSDTVLTITGLTDGTQYFIAAAAVDNEGNESVPVERTMVPRSLPKAPEGFSAIPEWHQIRLSWFKNRELDLQGYNLYRSVDPGAVFVKLNASVLTDTVFIDNNAANGIYYYYYVRAIDTGNNEGDTSAVLKSRVISFDQGVLLVDETEDGNGTLLNPTDEEVDNYYRSILDSFNFKEYDINSEGIPELADLGAFSTVIWSGEDGTNTASAMQARDALKEYMEAGGNFLYIGFKPSRAFYGSVVYPLQMLPGFFLYDMLKIKDLNFSIFARFYGGSAVQPEYNYIHIDSSKTNPVYLYHLPNIESIGAAPGGAEIYTYDTKFDSGTAQASMKGMPVGVEYMGTDYKAVTLSFPLYYMNQSEAKELLNMILLEKFNEVTGIKDGEPAVITGYRLSSNYPNPFNPVTLIDYQLPYRGHIKLSVYDILGREVAVLADEIKDAGHYTAVFNAADLSSGVYFYRMDAAPESGAKGFTHTNKMVLLK